MSGGASEAPWIEVRCPNTDCHLKARGQRLRGPDGRRGRVELMHVVCDECGYDDRLDRFDVLKWALVPQKKERRR